VLRFSNREVITALAFAGLVNMAMVIRHRALFTRATVMWRRSKPLTTAWRIARRRAVKKVFLLSLIVSGLSSSAVAQWPVK